MGELVDFVPVFRSRERLIVPPPDGGEVLLFTGIRYSPLEPLAVEFLSPSGAIPSGRKRRKGKNR